MDGFILNQIPKRSRKGKALARACPTGRWSGPEALQEFVQCRERSTRLLVTRRLTMAGFLVSDFNAKRDRALADLRGWVESSALKVPEHITEGLETLPAALVGLLAGENFGKRMVKVS